MKSAKKYVLPALKYCVSLGILAYLVYANQEKLLELATGEKQWSLIFAALAVTLTAVALTFVRWCWLVRALGVPFSMLEAFRLGFLGYLFMFLSVGVLGGDVLKIVFLLRQRPQSKPEAVASVMLDRAIGLYALFVVAAVGAASFDFNSAHVADLAQLETVKQLCRAVLVLVVLGAVAFGVLMLPGFSSSPVADMVGRLPKFLQPLAKLVAAVRMYRHRLGAVFASGFLSLGVHVLNIVSMYLIARGLNPAGARLDQEFVIAPLAMTAATVPLPGGLGAFEFAYDKLHVAVTGEPGIDVAVVYRAITLVVALVGLVFYMFSRAEVQELLHEAEAEEE